MQPSPELAAELRRIANLFLVSGVTLALLFLRAFAVTLSVTFIPRPCTWPGASSCSPASRSPTSTGST